MQIPLVLTLISPDRTGLVESVARAVADHGGNWLESRMCRLGGEFAGILRVEIPLAQKTALLAALQKLQTGGLQVVVRDDAPQPAAGRQTNQTGNRRGGSPRHRPRNHPRARSRRRERRGIFQRSRQRADERREFVQSQRTIALAGAMRFGRIEKRTGKNRRRLAGGCFVCGSRRLR